MVRLAILAKHNCHKDHGKSRKILMKIRHSLSFLNRDIKKSYGDISLFGLTTGFEIFIKTGTTLKFFLIKKIYKTYQIQFKLLVITWMTGTS